MKLNKDKIFVIIPVYNEENTVRDVVLSLMENEYQHILVIDDGSTQNINYALRGLQVVYIRHAINLGQGAALQTGFDYAKKFAAEIAITFDADGQHDVNDLQSLLLPIDQDKADIVLGSRFLQKAETKIPFLKKTVLKFARVINFLFSGLLLSDAHNGLRALNSLALEKIVIRQNRMAHASEIVQLLKKNALRYKEVPVTIHYTKSSQKKGQSIFNSVNIIFDLIFKKFER